MAQTSTATSHPGVLQRTLGIVLTFILMLSMASVATEVEGMGTAWAAAFILAALLLLAAAWRNWPLLWNPLGQLMRKLLGERGARMAFGFVAASLIVFITVVLLPSPDAMPAGTTDGLPDSAGQEAAILPGVPATGQSMD